MSAIGKIIKDIPIKITSLVDPYTGHDKLVGKIFMADFVEHHGDGEYSAQVSYKDKIYISTSCRIRFLKKEDYPELFI